MGKGTSVGMGKRSWSKEGQGWGQGRMGTYGVRGAREQQVLDGEAAGCRRGEHGQVLVIFQEEARVPHVCMRGELSVSCSVPSAGPSPLPWPQSYGDLLPFTSPVAPDRVPPNCPSVLRVLLSPPQHPKTSLLFQSPLPTAVLPVHPSSQALPTPHPNPPDLPVLPSLTSSL